MKTNISLCAGLVTVVVVSAKAAEFTVTTNADDGEGSLRALCAEAVSGDLIRIPGEIGPIALESEIDLMTPRKALRFEGVGEGEGRPVITGVGSHRTFWIGRQPAGVKHEFRNLIFRNLTSPDNGAAIFLNDYAPVGVTISNCLFEACEAPQGAALRLDRTDQWYEIQDCVFKDCFAQKGFAVYGGKVTVDRCRFEGNRSAENPSCFGANMAANIFTDCIFTNNVGGNGGCVSVAQSPTNFFYRCTFVDNETTGTGGAIYSRNPLTLWDCVFLRNRANDGGGAIFRYNGVFSAYNCVFEENSTRGGSNWQGGGAIFNRDDGSAECLLSNCVFRGNYNLAGSGSGGALCEHGSKGTLTIVDTLFERNQALNDTGAIKLTRKSVLRNCVFHENWCSNGVGAVWVNTGDVTYAFPQAMDPRPVLLENCTLYGNTTLSGRALVVVDNKQGQKVYSDENGDVISDLNAYVKANPGATVTTNVLCALDNVTFRHCTIVNNTIGGYWGMVNLYNPNQGSRVSFESTVFWGNRANERVYDVQGSIQKVNHTAFEQVENGFTVYEPENSGNNWFEGLIGDPCYDTEMAANDTSIVFLDGTKMPSLGIADRSSLRNKVTVTVGEDGRRKKRGELSGLADLGAFEFQPPIPMLLLMR